MGKAGRWLRSFLTGKKDKKAKDKADSQSLSSTVPTPASTPSAKEKRRWSFRRPAAAAASGKETDTSGQGQLASTSSHCFSVVHVVVQDQHAVAAPEVAIAAAMVVPPASKRSAVDAEEAAAIRIQSAFRSYLARKALCALRGMVKLQAMVRGQLVRRQANMTLRRMQALVAAQKRARAERLRLLEDDKPLTRTPRPPPSRRSPQHHRSLMPQEAVDRCSEENVKIVEVDNGGSDRHGTPRACGRRSSSCYSTPLSRTPAKAEVYQKVSPTPSAPTDASARTSSGRFETNSVSFSVASEASGRHRSSKACHAADHTALLFPNYMANTESSRAKARSQSAPRQRPAVGSEAAATASPSPSLSCERPPSGRGGRFRLSLDPRDLAGARGAPSPKSSVERMERCASQAPASSSEACPWAVRLDRSSVSLPGGECGSSSAREARRSHSQCDVSQVRALKFQ